MQPLEVETADVILRGDYKKRHRTDKFNIHNFHLLRRGEVFCFFINFRTLYRPKYHAIILQFSVANEQHFETFASVWVRDTEDKIHQFPPLPNIWGARILNIDQNFLNSGLTSMEVEVVTPVWLPVGNWKVRVRTHLVQAPRKYVSTYTCPKDIYILFNPWNENDQTYFRDASLLDEYILNEVGKICNGAGGWKVWNFQQFEKNVLMSFEKALEKNGGLPLHLRGDPVEVVRKVALFINAKEGGILVPQSMNGDTALEHEEGKPAVYWTGSHAILDQYVQTGKSVRYGECSVYAGVAASICRALGIPARCVTNLNSGNHNNATFHVDIMYDEQLNEISSGTDSIMRFHCWTDVWMQRPDLNKNHSEICYDGWQVIDAALKEKSKDVSLCGPVPLVAVLHGHTRVSREAPFVFTELNGVKTRWMRRDDGKLRLIDERDDIIGQQILTNEPLSGTHSGIADITSEYKYPNDTQYKRNAIEMANRNGVNKRTINVDLEEDKYVNDVSFEKECPRNIMFGDDLEITLNVHNTSVRTRTVLMEIIVDIVDHQRKGIEFVKSSGKMRVSLQPEQRLSKKLQVLAVEYIPRIPENYTLRAIAKCFVQETKQPWLSEQFLIAITSWPSLKIEVSATIYQYSTVNVTVSLDRVFAFPLTDCKLTIEGTVFREKELKLDNIPGGVIWSTSLNLHTTNSYGQQNIIVKFSSAELSKAEGWCTVIVKIAILAFTYSQKLTMQS